MRICSLVIVLAIAGCGSRSNIEIENAWARATPPGNSVAAVYAVLEAREADEIIAVSSPAAASIEIHTTSEAGGIVTMRPVATVSLPSQIPVKFESGGLHLMLIGLHEPLIAGKTVPLTFTFKSAAPITIEAEIVAPGDDAHAH